MQPSPRSTALPGIRVLDLGMFWAGPYAGKILGDFGAEVIKIESVRRPDPLRVQARGIYPGGEPGERPWNRSGLINERNRSKLGLTLDLTVPEGVDVFKRLVAVSDVVLENFSARVMAGFGLDYPVLRGVNPGIVMISIASQGLSGPERDYISFGNTLEQTGGMAYITGYPGEPPYYSSGAYPDAVSGILAAGAIVAGLRQRLRTGEGMHIELSQREAVSHLLGEMFLDYSMNQRVWEPMGNRHETKAPHGCYHCLGEDQWVTISVGDDAEWAGLCRAMDRPDLVADPAFITIAERYRNQDVLDAIIESWTSGLDRHEAARRLQAAGVPAGPVLRVPDLLQDPHLKARGFFETVEDTEAGCHPYYSRPMKLSVTPGASLRPAPLFGEHNRPLLHDLLGLTVSLIQHLEAKEIIGDVPQALIAGDD